MRGRRREGRREGGEANRLGEGEERGGSWAWYSYMGWIEREIWSRGMRGLKENKIK